ncbi:MAG: class III poly(R)-hydroxyalkanoic acid synthase subunit PhaC [Thermoproteota archaeon]|nr:class III poly(R)-hydroxyalkanoic acid synthase subunit PhaC [Thermoproteota archaeon]
MNELLLNHLIKDYLDFIKEPDNLIKLNKIKKLLSNIESIKTGQTEYEIIKETSLYRLLHYKPIKEQTYKYPVLIVYALINRSYIFDLQQNKSWIKNLLEHGMNVYLLDWKPPSKQDKYTNVDDYVNFFNYECVEQIKSIENVKQISLQGYCMGATLSLMYASLYQKNIKNLITIAPIVDADKDKSVIRNMSKFMDIDKVLFQYGNYPYELLYVVFASLKPFKQGVNKYLNLFKNLEDENFVQNFLRIEKWIYDTPPIAGETFRQWVKDIYQKNLFAKNKMVIGEDRIDLSKIKIPLLNIVAEADHLVTPECSIPLNNLVSSSDKSLMSFPTGHVGLIASGFSQKTVLPKIVKWINIH